MAGAIIQPPVVVSPKGTVNSADWKSITTTLGIFILSAIIAQLIIIIPGLNLGHNTDVYTGVILVILKIIQKSLDGPKVSTS